MRPDELERRLQERLDALGPAPRAELLHVLMLPDFERADRIGEFWSYPESRTFAELLIDCEEDQTLRAVLVGMVREADRGRQAHADSQRRMGNLSPRPSTIRAVPGSDGYFDEQVAATYDDDGPMFDPAVLTETVDFLAELAGGGRALEFGIGTGRIALPLAERGVHVHGIELSSPMTARLRAKPGGEAIGVTIGDFSSTTVDGSFSLVYLVYNTIENLITQAAQVACFRNAAAHLEPGGAFVIEVEVPQLRRLPPGDRFRVFSASEDYFGIDEIDVVTQRLVSHHLTLVDGKLDRLSMPFRYVWSSELDLMAQLAGMSLRERWGDWNREPFTSESRKHISVWEKKEP